MQLAEDIRKLVSSYGNTIVEDSRLVGMLMDMHSFNDFPAIQNIVKYIISNGYAHRFINGSEDSRQRLVKEIAFKSGYDIKHIKYVADCMVYAVHNRTSNPQFPKSNHPNKKHPVKWFWISALFLVILSTLSFWIFNSRDITLYRIQENGLYGFIDSLGNVKIQPQYKYVSSFSSSGYATVISSIQFKKKVENHKDPLQNLISGDTIVLHYGYIDKKNKLVVDTTNVISIPHYLFGYFELNEDEIENLCTRFINNSLEFREHLFPELMLNSNRYIFQDKESGLLGYKNIKDEVVISPKYKYCKSFHNDVAFVAEYEKPKDNISEDNINSNLTESLNCFSLIDASGNVLKSKAWSYVQDFVSEKTWVKTIKISQDENGEFSFKGDCFQIDKKCKILIGPIGGVAQSLVYNNRSKDDLFVYVMPPMPLLDNSPKYSFVNSEGKFITDFNSDGVLSLWSADSKPEVFNDVTRFGNGYAGVRVYQEVNKETKPRWTFIDTKCEFVSEETFDSILPFNEGLSPVQQCNDFKGLGQWGVLNTNFDLVVPYKYNAIGIFNKGLAYAMIWGATSDREGYINRKGEFVWSTTRQK